MNQTIANARGLLATHGEQPHLSTLSAPDVALVLSFIFHRFGAPVDAGELPTRVVSAIRRLEVALEAPNLGLSHVLLPSTGIPTPGTSDAAVTGSASGPTEDLWSEIMRYAESGETPTPDRLKEWASQHSRRIPTAAALGTAVAKQDQVGDGPAEGDDDLVDKVYELRAAVQDNSRVSSSARTQRVASAAERELIAGIRAMQARLRVLECRSQAFASGAV